VRLLRTLWDRYSRPWRYAPRHCKRPRVGLWPDDDQEWIDAIRRMAQRRHTLAGTLQTV
jgi:mannose/cellobiose epimerase-like protein (N-acyl-D-glucosamine 2-epimerase family)